MIKKFQEIFFPDYTFGVSSTLKYKDFVFKFLIQGKQGHEIFNASSFFIRNLEGWSNGHSDINDYYSSENLKARYAHPGKHVKTYERSNLFVEDASYIRLRKVSLGYYIPKAALDYIFVSKAEVYISAKNLFTITNYTGYNPEVSSKNASWNSSTITPGVDYGAYPIEKSIILGFKVQF